jgi:hypothetical protein
MRNRTRPSDSATEAASTNDPQGQPHRPADQRRRDPRRPGDPAVLFAAADNERSTLQWTPHTRDLGGIVESAWRWEKDGPPPPRD